MNPETPVRIRVRARKRGGAEAACWAHNPKVPGSKPGLANINFFYMFFIIRPNWRNWIARMTSNHKVAGSSPALGEYARLAQSVERTPFKRVVVGSSPTSGGGKRQTLGLEPEVSGIWRNIF